MAYENVILDTKFRKMRQKAKLNLDSSQDRNDPEVFVCFSMKAIRPDCLSLT